MDLVNMTYHQDRCQFMFAKGIAPDTRGTNEYYGGASPNTTNVYFSDFSDDPWQQASVRKVCSPGGEAGESVRACVRACASLPSLSPLCLLSVPSLPSLSLCLCLCLCLPVVLFVTVVFMSLSCTLFFWEQELKDSLPYEMVQCNGCGHCFDLHYPSSDDPNVLKQSRTRFETYLAEWLK